jgi:putative Mg2+ transporter-C (MgtC) family protein
MSTWQAVWQAVASDFADLDAPQAARIGVRLLFAAVLGGIIGFEREQKGKAAGLRTHMLVALGSALFVIVVQFPDGSMADVSRVIQGLVAGIGFLGAGTILHAQRERDIQGLTTAASVWLTAAIGVAAGLGRESTALLTTILAVVVLAVMPWITGRAFPPHEPELPKAEEPSEPPDRPDPKKAHPTERARGARKSR